MLFYFRKFLTYISLFFKHGALSDKDIRKLLGHHIFIYPFSKKNLKPSSYNLTASKCAFIRENGKQKLICDGEKITIPPHKTAIIETNESIYVSKWITGTYHSRVKLVNRGLGHIGTTLDPSYFGISAIALHNINDESIDINVGESIATIMFYTTKSKSSGEHDNLTGRTDANINLDPSDWDINNKDKRTVIIIEKDLNEGEYIKSNDAVKIIRDVKKKNDKRIKDKKIFVYDLDQPECRECRICKDKEVCSFKLLKEYMSQDEKKKEIIKDINEWRNEPFRVSKESLIRVVKNYVRGENFDKDTFIYSLITLVVGILTIFSLIYFISISKNKEMRLTMRTIIAVVIPTVTIIIGMIVNRRKVDK